MAGPERSEVLNMVRRFPRAVSLLLPILIAFASLDCGGGGSDGTGPSDSETPRATSVLLTPDSVHLDSIGATAQLSAVIRDQHGQVMAGAAVSWTSSSPQVASVSSSGLVTALADGSTVIRATSGTASATGRAIVARVLFAAHILEVAPLAVSGLSHGDVDGDGDLDFLAAYHWEGRIALWLNQGGAPPSWSKRQVGLGFREPLYAHLADVDGDGLLDAVATGVGPDDGLVAWWRNDGGDPGAWSVQQIETLFTGASGIVSGDFDGDGRTDLLGAAINDSEIAWWQNLGGDPLGWRKQTVAGDFSGVQSVVAADLDGDGRVDILGGAGPDGENRDQVAWWRNGGGDPVQWSKHLIAEHFTFAHWVHATDMDGDGRMDVLAMSYSDNQLAWWRNEGGSPPGWTRGIIDGSFAHPLTLVSGDMDGDGDMDVVGTGWAPGHEVAWWEARGSSPGIIWQKHTIATSFTGAWPLLVADLDGDGDPDVVAGADVLNSGGQDAPLTWWENQGRGGS